MTTTNESQIQSLIFKNAYATYIWKTMHLVNFQHSNLLHYLGLTLTSRWVGLIPTTDFPSGRRPCCLRLPTLLFRPNYKFRLTQTILFSQDPNMTFPQTMFQANKLQEYFTSSTRKMLILVVDTKVVLLIYFIHNFQVAYIHTRFVQQKKKSFLQTYPCWH